MKPPNSHSTGGIQPHTEQHLRVLIAHSDVERLNTVSGLVTALGHEVVARNTDLASVGTLTAVEQPEVAIIIVGENSDRALALIERVVKEAVCPVIALLDVEDRAFVNQAAKRGVFAYISHGDAAGLRGSIEVVLHRFAEYHNLQGAFGRRAVIEQAKGVLMERHKIDDKEAFERMRTTSRKQGRRVEAVAEAIILSRPLEGENTKPSV